jgi:hypothetical protein
MVFGANNILRADEHIIRKSIVGDINIFKSLDKFIVIRFNSKGIQIADICNDLDELVNLIRLSFEE